MTDVWIVLVEDRHADVDALPYSTEDQAVAVARAAVEANAQHPGSIDWDADLTPAVYGDNDT